MTFPMMNLTWASFAVLGGLALFQTLHYTLGAWRHFAGSPHRFRITAAVLAGWLIHGALFLGLVPALGGYEGALPLVVLALYLPSLLALLALAISPSARAAVDGMSLRWLIASVEGPARILVGSLFIVWTLLDALPGTFAWVAGPGDILAGAFAFVAVQLLQPLARRAGAHGPHWSVNDLLPVAGSLGPADVTRVAVAAGIVGFGILDFVAAPLSSVIALGEGAVPHALGELPLGLVPMYLVPQVLLLEVLAMRQLVVLWRAHREASAMTEASTA